VDQLRIVIPQSIRHESFLRYAQFRWLKIALVLVAVTSASYVYFATQLDFRLQHSGGTFYGYTLGIIGALMIVWLAYLGIRKRRTTARSGMLKGWVSAHIYLGSALLVIVTLHTGLQFGWNVHTLAYGFLVVVIASGAFGAAVYSYLPRKLSENRAEMTEAQMLAVIRSFDLRLHTTAQPLDQRRAEIVSLSIEHSRLAGNFFQRITASTRTCGTRGALEEIGRLDPSPDPEVTAAMVQVTEILKRKSDMLARCRHHIRIRTALQMWLYIHIPGSIALIAAVTAHVVAVLFYR
jgi:hypothetical protein